MANKVAVVTGASSGIGFNLAKVFAENGFDLIVGSAGGRIEEAASELQGSGTEVKAVQADLATYEVVDKFWSSVEADGRKIDAVAINAGVGVGGLFVDTDLKEEINLVRLNVEGTVHLAKHAVKKLVSQGEGRILITASIASEMVAPREAVYAASKAFDLSFARSLRDELEGTGVTVTALQPGPTDTEFFDRAGLGNTKAGTKGKTESEPYDVAKEGFEALMAGKDHVYAASAKTKLEGALSGLTPNSVMAKMHDNMAKPLDQEK